MGNLDPALDLHSIAALLTSRKGTRSDLIARAIPAVAEIVEGCAADGLMGARGPILPSAKGRTANGIG
jgi:hypothetical protein